MTVSISNFDEHHLPDASTAESSLREVLHAFETNGVAGEHVTASNSGTFYGGGWFSFFSGTSYAYSSKDPAHYAFVATGDLHYYFPPFSGSMSDGPTSHTLWGTIESITLGGGVTKGQIVDPLITFTFDQPIFGDVSEGRANDTHDVIWGLMNGSVDGADDRLGSGTHGGLTTVLETNGLDISMSIADLVGHNFATETDLALAA